MSRALVPGPPRPPRNSRIRLRWWVLLAAIVFVPLPLAVPLALLGGATWAGVRVLAHRRERRRRGVERVDPALIHLGRDSDGRQLSLHEDQLGAHGLILGASGAGKSTTLLTILNQQILAGKGAVAIDLKGSREFIEEMGAAAAAAGRRLRVWTLDGPERWNPLAVGNPTELKDKLISTERFTEPHYQRAAERYVQMAFTVLAEVEPDTPASLGRVLELMSPTRLATLARQLEPTRAAYVQEYVRDLGPDQLSAVRGFGSRLAVIVESHTGPYLSPGPEAIDLRHTLDGGDVVLFSLNSSSYGQLSAQLGALVLQDLVSTAGARERDPAAGRVPATVAIDEFSGLGADHVMALVSRGRSAGISVLLATQELADLDRISRSFRNQVVGSTAVKIAHRQDIAESAYEVARLSGTEQVWERSYSRTDPSFLGRASGSGAGAARVNDRLVVRPRVDPSVVQTLATGEIVLITKLPRSDTRLAQVEPLGIWARGVSQTGPGGRPSQLDGERGERGLGGVGRVGPGSRGRGRADAGRGARDGGR